MGFLVDCKSQNCGYWNRTDLTSAYFSDINSFPVLSTDEERKLLEKAKSKNKAVSIAARKKLVECNQRFVVSVARRWQKGDNLLDIVNEANIGLLHAIDNYDLDRKQKFITYAVWWIRKYINNYVIFKEKPVVPANALKLYTYVPKARNKFFIENYRYPTLDELKDVLLSEYNVVVAHDEDLANMTMTSVDESYFEPNDYPQSDNVTDFDIATSTNNIDDDVEKKDYAEIVRCLMKYLNDKEKMVVKSFYGIGCQEQTLDTIGDKMEISKERVRQLLNSSLKKMQQKANLIQNI